MSEAARKMRSRREILHGVGLAGGLSGLAWAASADARVSPVAAGGPGQPSAGHGAPGDIASARDFGAIGDGVADDTAALQAWLDAGAAGRTIRLPRGRYRVSATLSARVRDDSLNGFRLAIFGDGAANTEILFAGDRDTPALRLVGNMPHFDNLVVRGLRIALPDGGPAGLGQGAAFQLENFRNFSVEDIRTFRAGTGVRLIGCLVGRVCNYLSYYDRRGMVLERGTYLSTPNAISLELCSILASFEAGVTLTAPTLVRIGNGSTIEGVGVENPGGETAGLVVVNSGHAGGISVIADGVYFEGNQSHDVRIRHTEKSAIYRFSGCTFNRPGGTVPRRSAILFDAGSAALDAQAVLDVRSSAFMGYGADYVPDPNVKAVAFNLARGYRGLAFLDDGALYHHAGERPAAPVDRNQAESTSRSSR